MKDRLVCTIATREIQDVFALTEPAMRAYAERCNADFKVVAETTANPPHFAKYELIKELADEPWLRVLYLDADIYCRKNAPDIFEEYHYTAARSEFPNPHQAVVFESIAWIRENADPLWKSSVYYNTGVLLLDFSALTKLAAEIEKVRPMSGRFFEQDQLNVLMKRAGVPEEQLTLAWNAPVGPRWRPVVEDYGRVHFIHGTAVKPKDKRKTLQEFIAKYP